MFFFFVIKGSHAGLLLAFTTVSMTMSVHKKKTRGKVIYLWVSVLQITQSSMVGSSQVHWCFGAFKKVLIDSKLVLEKTVEV